MKERKFFRELQKQFSVSIEDAGKKVVFHATQSPKKMRLVVERNHKVTMKEVVDELGYVLKLINTGETDRCFQKEVSAWFYKSVYFMTD